MNNTHTTTHLPSLIPPPLRQDLTSTNQTFLGRSYVVFKNPLSLGYFRLPAPHALAARTFDGFSPLEKILPKLQTKSNYWRALPTDQALQQLFTLTIQLTNAGLLTTNAASTLARTRKSKELKKKYRFESAISHILFFRKSLCDPDPFLNRCFPLVRWIFHPLTLWLSATFILASLLLAITKFDAIKHQSANFFTLENLALSWILFFAIKIAHEFGHAFTAKRFGAEVHEMGFLFILFTPYLFCNVTDSWLANKNARIATSSAGIAIELFIASVATWLWAFSQPGLFHQLCFNAMLLASISTLLFNANPLMKFDGYYIVTDLLEIPNLRAKSNAWISHWAQRTLLGLRQTITPHPTHESGPLFGLYAVAAYAYGWFIIYNISTHLFNMLEPLGLQFISQSYVGLFLFVSIALPIYRLGRNATRSPDFKTSGIPRLQLLSLSILTLTLASFLIPWQTSIHRLAALDHQHVISISSPAPGFLRQILVREGQTVLPHQPLATIENPDLNHQLNSARIQKEALLVQYRSALLSSDSPEIRQSSAALAKIISETDEQIAALEKKLASLHLTAPTHGIIRTRRPADQLGRLFTPGQPVLQIGKPLTNKLIIPLDEKQSRHIQAGQPITAQFDALPGKKFYGTITSAPVAQQNQFQIPSLANILGGDVPAQLDPSGTPLPSIPHFEAEATLNIDPQSLELLRPHAKARVRIATRKTNLASAIWESLLHLLDPATLL